MNSTRISGNLEKLEPPQLFHHLTLSDCYPSREEMLRAVETYDKYLALYKSEGYVCVSMNGRDSGRWLATLGGYSSLATGITVGSLADLVSEVRKDDFAPLITPLMVSGENIDELS